MILIFSTDTISYNLLTYYYFVKAPDIDVDYNFLNNLPKHYGINFPGEFIGKLDGALFENISITNIEEKYYIIYVNYKSYKEGVFYAQDSLFKILKHTPKEFTKWVIKKLGSYTTPKFIEKSILDSFEKDLDSLYDEVMIKDIIE